MELIQGIIDYSFADNAVRTPLTSEVYTPIRESIRGIAWQVQADMDDLVRCYEARTNTLTNGEVHEAIITRVVANDYRDHNGELKKLTQKALKEIYEDYHSIDRAIAEGVLMKR